MKGIWFMVDRCIVGGVSLKCGNNSEDELGSIGFRLVFCIYIVVEIKVGF